VYFAPRLFTRLMGERDRAPLGEAAWGDATLSVEGSYQNVLTGERHQGGSLRVADLLAAFPVALLVSSDR